jgi:hypothetical protein
MKTFEFGECLNYIIMGPGAKYSNGPLWYTLSPDLDTGPLLPNDICTSLSLSLSVALPVHPTDLAHRAETY